MYKVAFVDDDSSAFSDYQKRLARKGIDLSFVDNCSSMEDIVEWVTKNCIESLLVDHKLTAKYAFQGTNVVAYINNHLPDLPCIILTNYPEDSENDNLVMKNLILDRNIMSADDISPFADIIKQSAEVFRNRLKAHLDEYEALLNKKKNGNITADEDEQFLHLYKLLRLYGEVDDVATELLRPDVDKKLDTLIDKLDYYLQNKK